MPNQIERKQLLTRTLINFSIGISAVRNQGNGIAGIIRKRLEKAFDIDVFFKSLRHPDSSAFEAYLNDLTHELFGLKGKSTNGKPAGKVRWGTARKCVNLLLRSMVYNGHMWSWYKVNELDFEPGGIMDRLELPLDSHVVAGIREDCARFGLQFDPPANAFRIINLKKVDNSYFQRKASEIAELRGVCRVDLDMYYWRSQK